MKGFEKFIMDIHYVSNVSEDRVHICLHNIKVKTDHHIIVSSDGKEVLVLDQTICSFIVGNTNKTVCVKINRKLTDDEIKFVASDKFIKCNLSANNFKKLD